MPVPKTDQEKLQQLFIMVVCFAVAGISLLVLQFVAACIAVVLLVAFAFTWSVKKLKSQHRLGFLAFAVAIVLVVNYLELRSRDAVAAEQQKLVTENAAKKASDERVATDKAELAFRKMSPAEHLAMAKQDLWRGANATEVEDGKKHLTALKGTSLQRQGEAVGAQFERERATDIEEGQEQARLAYGRVVQKTLYDRDMDAQVDVSGVRHTTLKITWPLATPMFAYKFSEEFPDLTGNLQSLGFKKVILTDGIEHSWDWNLGG